MAILIDDKNKQPTAQTQQGSGFTNISRILAANKGNTVGSSVNDSLKKKSDALQGNIQQGATQAEQNAKGQAVNQDAYSGVFSKDGSGNTQVADRTLTDAEKNEINKAATSNYQDVSIQNQDQLQGKAQQLASFGQGNNLQGFVQSQFGGNKNYNQGMSAFDTLLVGQNQNQLRNIANTSQQSLQQLVAARNNVDQLNSQIGGQNAVYKTDLANQLAGAGTGLVTDANASAASLTDKLKAAQNGQPVDFSDQEMAELGVKPGDNYGLNIDQLLPNVTSGSTYNLNRYNNLKDLATLTSNADLNASLGQINPAKADALKKIVQESNTGYQTAQQQVTDQQNKVDSTQKEIQRNQAIVNAVTSKSPQALQAIGVTYRPMQSRYGTGGVYLDSNGNQISLEDLKAHALANINTSQGSLATDQATLQTARSGLTPYTNIGRLLTGK